MKSRNPLARLRMLAIASGAAVLSVLAQNSATPPVQDWGRVTALADMTLGRAVHQATLLHSGEVLISGGCTAGCESGLTATEIFDPAAKAFRATGEMSTPRNSHTASLLLDGKVFIAGGWVGSRTTSSTEIYDPASGRFSQGPTMAARRAGAAAIVLPDGRVLITGGEADIDDVASSIEVFDPASGKLSVMGQMTTPRALHTATLLSDGRVLLAGGRRGRRQEISSTEIFDSDTGQSQPAGDMSIARHKHAAVLLMDGRVMILGGSRTISGHDELLATTEIYDVARRAYSSGPVMSSPRHKIAGAAVVLASGDVIIAGGAAQMERWSAGAPRFTPIAGSTSERAEFATANVLRDGSVLVLGGYGEGIRPFATARLLTP
jgi:hypothetical protein